MDILVNQKKWKKERNRTKWRVRVFLASWHPYVSSARNRKCATIARTAIDVTVRRYVFLVHFNVVL